MCCQLFVKYFETDIMKYTSTDINNVNTIKHTWVRFASKFNGIGIIPHVSK